MKDRGTIRRGLSSPHVLRATRVWVALAGLLALFALGLGVRRSVFLAQAQWVGADELPFTLESALAFRRIRQVVEKGSLPDREMAIQHPEGIVVRETDTTGAEWAYAALSRWFPEALPLASRVRWIHVAWFCLGIPFVALWAGWSTRSRLAGFVAGAFYAVAAASVIRSTGQELSHENTALPFLAAHLALAALSGRRAGWRFWLARAGSALCLALSLVLWDMIQFYVLLWAVSAFARQLVFVQGARPPNELGAFLLEGAVLVLAGVTNPYLRAHGFPLSPALLLAYGTWMGVALRKVLGSRERAPSSQRWLVAGAGLIPLAVGLLVAGSYGASYGHFLDLLAAKIQFLNVKPANPAWLSFSQRIMWVPALHSATLDLTFQLFPTILLLTILAAVVLWCSDFRSNPEFVQLLFFHIASLMAYVLFARFHVFVALFAAGLLGFFAAWGGRGRWWRLLLVVLLLGAGLCVEGAHVLAQRERWGRPNVYYEEVAGLVERLKVSVTPEPVLANFGISASILTYGGCPILLHPKFESEEIRERVQDYVNLLFGGTEEELGAWMRARGTRYYVYALGEFSSIAPDQQLRYMANIMNPSTNSPAWKFEFAPERARHFEELWSNRKYRLLRLISGDDAQEAERRALEAEKRFQGGALGSAQRASMGALEFDEDNERAMTVLRHVLSLKEQGFSYTGDDAEQE